MGVVHNELTCLICYDKFTSLRALAEHIRVSHSRAGWQVRALLLVLLLLCSAACGSQSTQSLKQERDFWEAQYKVARTQERINAQQAEEAISRYEDCVGKYVSLEKAAALHLRREGRKLP